MLFDIDLSENFSFKVGPHLYAVEFVDREDHRLDEGGSYGSLIHKESKIIIREDCSYEMKLSTFFHELIHVMEDIYHIKISHKDLNLLAEIMSMVLLFEFSVEEDSEDEEEEASKKEK